MQTGLTEGTAQRCYLQEFPRFREKAGNSWRICKDFAGF